jgi:hypothetical protein
MLYSGLLCCLSFEFFISGIFVFYLLLFGASFEYVSHESSTSQMADNTHSNYGGAGGNGDGALLAPPRLTPSETFIAAQTEVLR